MPDDVLIIGAGPTGLTLAIELRRYGIPIQIVESAAQRTDKSKALVVWARTLELLDRGPGAARFVNAGFKEDAVNFVAGDKQIGRVDMGSVRSPYPYALMLPQSDTERLLEEHLNELGVNVSRQVEVVSLTLREDGGDAVLRYPDGRQEKRSAGWVIGCDGAHSIVRHTVGATFDGETLDSDWVLADAHMRGYPWPDSEVSIYWHSEGVFVIFPISPGRYRVIANVAATGTEHPSTPTLAQVQAIIDRRGPPGMTAFHPIWLSGFRINDRKVSQYRWGRAFLAGDAAHVHSPAGGQGMNTGMQDAFNLAWKLALVAKGLCPDKLLDSYSSERSYVGDQVLKAAGRLTEVGTLSNPVAQAIRNMASQLLLGLTPVQHALADTMSEVSIGYPNSPLNGVSLAANLEPTAGQRVLPVDGETPFGSGATPRFALLAQQGTAVDHLLARHAAILEPTPRDPPSPEAAWLIRPDGYVASVAPQGHEAELEAYLDRLITEHQARPTP
jgi:2-polyprenyl-6-methoxyphenol hydroxylase-like FAD-dependent oxidoreductase